MHSICWEPAPLGGGRTGWVRAAAPARLDGIAALAARPDWRGLPTAPKGGAEGGFAGSYNRRGICCLRPKEIHPFRGGGRAGRGNGGTVRHCSCLGIPEQGGGLQGAIICGAFVECSHFGWEPTPWGEGARVWVRAAAPAGLGGLAAIRRPTRAAGATDCAQGRGGGGTMRQKGICAPELRGRRGLTCDMRDYRLR